MAMRSSLPGEERGQTAAPLPFSDWSLTTVVLEVVTALVSNRDACAAVELGSGVSTVAIARALPRGGSLTSLEHESGWAERVRGRLAAEDLDAEVIDAPLGPHPLALGRADWYASEAVAELPERIDLLLVDGPPGNEEGIELSRYPALPALADRLAPGSVVLLDDAQRPGEREIQRRWRREHPIEFETAADGRLAVGTWR